MKTIACSLGAVALALVILPPLLFMTHALTDEALMKGLMLAGTLLWFVTAPVWMRGAAKS